MNKNCIVCGKEFEARQSNYTICSPECRRKREQKQQIKYNQIWKTEEYKKIRNERDRKRRREYRKNNPRLCTICGEPLCFEFRSARKMHEECVIKEAAKSYIEAGHMPRVQLSRLNSIGCTVKDVKEWINQHKQES